LPAVTLPSSPLADPSPPPLGVSGAGGPLAQSIPEPTVLNMLELVVLAVAWRFVIRAHPTKAYFSSRIAKVLSLKTRDGGISTPAVSWSRSCCWSPGGGPC
jgi:hypothetical protein